MATRFGPDPLLDELETQRLEFEAQFGGDRKKIAEYYMEYQKQFADRLVTSVRPVSGTEPEGGKPGKSAAGSASSPAQAGTGAASNAARRQSSPAAPRAS